MGRGRGYYRSYAVALTDAEKKLARDALHRRFKVLSSFVLFLRSITLCSQGTLGKGPKRAASIRPLWIPYFTIMISLIQFIVMYSHLLLSRLFFP